MKEKLTKDNLKSKILSDTEFIQKANASESKYEAVSNFNRFNCITPNTKLIIVGTITPPKGMNRGYFYTAPRNNIYKLIDMALGTNLQQLKDSLPTADNKEKTLFEIQKTLKEHNIAFLDVMKFALRLKDSSEDLDIKYFTLDVESFKNLPNSVHFICNSRLAEDGYLEICKRLNRKPNYEYLTQFWMKLDKNAWVNSIRTHTSSKTLES